VKVEDVLSNPLHVLANTERILQQSASLHRPPPSSQHPLAQSSNSRLDLAGSFHTHHTLFASTTPVAAPFFTTDKARAVEEMMRRLNIKHSAPRAWDDAVAEVNRTVLHRYTHPKSASITVAMTVPSKATSTLTKASFGFRAYPPLMHDPSNTHASINKHHNDGAPRRAPLRPLGWLLVNHLSFTSRG
jgi:hypothetical protein